MFKAERLIVALRCAAGTVFTPHPSHFKLTLTCPANPGEGESELIAVSHVDDIYAILAMTARNALVSMQRPEDYGHNQGETHRFAEDIDVTCNFVETGLSGKAVKALQKFLPLSVADHFAAECRIEMLERAIVLAKTVPDTADFFPSGKWATIQVMQARVEAREAAAKIGVRNMRLRFGKVPGL